MAWSLRTRIVGVEYMPEISPESWRLVAPTANVWLRPEHTSPLDTQVLFGEEVEFLEEHGGFTQVRTRVDEKTGWVHHARTLFEPAQILPPITHRVVLPRTFAFSLPDQKTRPRYVLSMNSRISAGREAEHNGRLFVQIQSAINGPAWVFSEAVRPVEYQAEDFVAVAELFIGTVYGWGCRDANPGIDCSALLHAALLAAGYQSFPRDTKDQMVLFGSSEDTFERLQRGDIVFFPGHVVIMVNSRECVHATGRMPHNIVLKQTLQEVINERQMAGDSVAMRVHRLSDYPFA